MDDIALVVGILTDALSVPVSTEIPPTRPERLLHVNYQTRDSDALLHRGTAYLTAWGSSDSDAQGLAETAAYALSDAAQTHDLLSAAYLQRIDRDTWSRDGQARCTAEVELTINT